jgi:hypothetical protein
LLKRVERRTQAPVFFAGAGGKVRKRSFFFASDNRDEATATFLNKKIIPYYSERASKSEFFYLLEPVNELLTLS